ncbi:hypothetical protein ACQPXB_32710 [Amycolatopsis sp. CA-161197]
MTHELTHEYFGDAVPVRCSDDMSLSDGLARSGPASTGVTSADCPPGWRY